MPIQHEENKTLGTWGNQKNCNPEPNGDRGTGLGCLGETNGSEQIRICRENWTWENPLINSGGEDNGGVFDQLIEAILEQLADNANRKEVLEQQLEKIKSIRQQINTLDEEK